MENICCENILCHYFFHHYCLIFQSKKRRSQQHLLEQEESFHLLTMEQECCKFQMSWKNKQITNKHKNNKHRINKITNPTARVLLGRYVDLGDFTLNKSINLVNRFRARALPPTDQKKWKIKTQESVKMSKQ